MDTFKNLDRSTINAQSQLLLGAYVLYITFFMYSQETFPKALPVFIFRFVDLDFFLRFRLKSLIVCAKFTRFGKIIEYDFSFFF